jgi:hypothetical protein
MPSPDSRSPSAKLEIAAQVAIWAARVATSYPLLYLIWFHRAKPSVLFSVIDAMWFVVPLCAGVIVHVAVGALRGGRPGPSRGDEVRRTSCWMLAASLLQLPLRIRADYWDLVTLESVTVVGIVAMRELNFGRARWIGPFAIALFVAWLPFAPIAANLDVGAYLANALAFAALMLHTAFGVLESRQPSAVSTVALPRAATGASWRSLGPYRGVLLTAGVLQLGMLAWVLRDDGVLVLLVVGGLAIPVLAYGSIVVVCYLAFGAWRHEGPRGTPRGATGWQITAFGLLAATTLTNPVTLLAPARLIAAHARAERRRERARVSDGGPGSRTGPS